MRLSESEIDAAMESADWPRSLLSPFVQAKLRVLARAVEVATAERCAKVCSEYGDTEWAKFKRGPAPYQGNPYTEGLSDAAHELHNAIRAAYKEQPCKS